MKKIITLLMAALLSVSLCSCGTDTSAPDTAQENVTQEQSKDVSAEKDKEEKETASDNELSAENTDKTDTTEEKSEEIQKTQKELQQHGIILLQLFLCFFRKYISERSNRTKSFFRNSMQFCLIADGCFYFASILIYSALSFEYTIFWLEYSP